MKLHVLGIDLGTACRAVKEWTCSHVVDDFD